LLENEDRNAIRRGGPDQAGFSRRTRPPSKGSPCRPRPSNSPPTLSPEQIKWLALVLDGKQHQAIVRKRALKHLRLFAPNAGAGAVGPGFRFVALC